VNNYEGIFIINPSLKEEDLKNVFKAVSESVVKAGGAIVKEESWGKRQLTYPVNKLKEAYYFKLDFTAPAAVISKLEGGYKLNTDIMRVMVTKR